MVGVITAADNVSLFDVPVVATIRSDFNVESSTSRDFVFKAKGLNLKVKTCEVDVDVAVVVGLEGAVKV